MWLVCSEESGDSVWRPFRKATKNGGYHRFRVHICRIKTDTALRSVFSRPLMAVNLNICSCFSCLMQVLPRGPNKRKSVELMDQANQENIPQGVEGQQTTHHPQKIPRESYDEIPVSGILCHSVSENYLDDSELLPLEDCEGELRAAYGLLNSTDWRDQFQALNATRRIAVHHRELLENNMSTLIPLVLNAADSLRSGLAKNALLCISNIYAKLSPGIAASIPSTLPLLLLKSITDKRFVREEALKCVEAVVTKCACKETIDSLCQTAGDKNAEICLLAATSLEKSLSVLNMSLADLDVTDTLLAALAKLLQERRSETKSAAKRTLQLLTATFGAPLLTQRTMESVPSLSQRAVLDLLAKPSERPKTSSAGFRAFLKSKPKANSNDDLL
eukprot:GILJ01003783.1.p1 GENE.GILJ01003783.1~~GILJ01003783.1.p1  ORF type:complete len:389 (-),score=34.42 GILJ01003783.1:167-1333(-)